MDMALSWRTPDLLQYPKERSPRLEMWLFLRPWAESIPTAILPCLTDGPGDPTSGSQTYMPVVLIVMQELLILCIVGLK